jgi:DNA-binding response OmpR family regulator
MHIAFLEDEPIIAAQTEEFLRADGHSVVVFNSGRALLRSLRRQTFDLFILDWNVDDLSGMQVMREIRQQARLNTPIIFLTHRQFERDVVEAFESGADDYCTRPVREKELLARIKVLQRHFYGVPTTHSNPTLHGYTFNAVSNTVTWVHELQTQSARLSDKEFKLAHFFFESANRPISRTRLLREIWGSEDNTMTRTLDVHICRVRSRLGLSSTSENFQLKAIHGFGYKLINLQDDLLGKSREMA